MAIFGADLTRVTIPEMPNNDTWARGFSRSGHGHVRRPAGSAGFRIQRLGLISANHDNQISKTILRKERIYTQPEYHRSYHGRRIPGERRPGHGPVHAPPPPACSHPTATRSWTKARSSRPWPRCWEQSAYSGSITVSWPGTTPTPTRRPWRASARTT